ncbi:MAG: hypothetical protein H6607_09425 [Flavobacteriales bacterium]|nr:hypothetical protein [Flavobacteriales bacterium]
MARKRFITLGLLICPWFLQSKAKEVDTTYFDSIRNYEYQLEGLSHRIINGADQNERATSCYYFVQTLKKALAVPGSFNYNFTLINTVSILKPDDEKFRLFTWNLLLDSSRFMYFGAIQMNNSDSLILHGLYDSSDYIKDVDYSTVDCRHWVGALYYQIYHYSYKKKDYYLLFGWDGDNEFINKKIVDVLAFDESNTPYFGLPIFEDEVDDYKSRMIFTFAERATIPCRYDKEKNHIVFENLSPQNEMLKGRYQYYLPDGTYSYMSFVKGFWQLQNRELFDDEAEHTFDLRPPNGTEGKDYQKKKKGFFSFLKRKKKEAF